MLVTNLEYIHIYAQNIIYSYIAILMYMFFYYKILGCKMTVKILNYIFITFQVFLKCLLILCYSLSFATVLTVVDVKQTTGIW